MQRSHSLTHQFSRLLARRTIEGLHLRRPKRSTTRWVACARRPSTQVKSSHALGHSPLGGLTAPNERGRATGWQLWGLLSAGLLFGSTVIAQDLHPTTSTTLIVDGTERWYRSITIPAGVRLTLRGSGAAILRCSGDITIRGVVDASAIRYQSGPAGGIAGNGAILQSATNVVDGDAMPLRLVGGGEGMDRQGLVCSFAGCLPYPVPGGGGGGAVRLEAGGSFTLAFGAQILADGKRGGVDPSGLVSGMPGAGGTVHLRSFGTMQIDGYIRALGPTPGQGDGVVRLESYGQPPIIGGTVLPTPRSWSLPRIQEVAPPVPGRNWRVAGTAGLGNGVYIAVAGRAGSQVNSYGTFLLDPATAATLGVMVTAGTLQPPFMGEPVGQFSFPVPPINALRGLSFEVQGLNWQTNLPRRYTNAFRTTVQ